MIRLYHVIEAEVTIDQITTFVALWKDLVMETEAHRSRFIESNQAVGPLVLELLMQTNGYAE